MPSTSISCRLEYREPVRRRWPTVICGAFASSRSTATFASLWLQDRLPDFFQINPEIELRLVATQDFLAMESSLRPDVFITKMAHVRSWYTSARLFHDVVYPVCSPQYLDEHPRLQTLHSLREADLLDLSPYGRSQLAEHVDWSVWLAFHGINLGERSPASRPVFACNDYSAPDKASDCAF